MSNIIQFPIKNANFKNKIFLKDPQVIGSKFPDIEMKENIIKHEGFFLFFEPNSPDKFVAEAQVHIERFFNNVKEMEIERVGFNFKIHVPKLKKEDLCDFIYIYPYVEIDEDFIDFEYFKEIRSILSEIDIEIQKEAFELKSNLFF